MKFVQIAHSATWVPTDGEVDQGMYEHLYGLTEDGHVYYFDYGTGEWKELPGAVPQ